MDYTCKISVIIPVYNMAPYLDRTIASWTDQTLKDIEIICIDDGSSDESLQKLHEYAQKDNRIQVYAFPENKSAWCARNLGIEKACGEYILFADADDTALPETCEELALAIDEAQTDILQYPIEVLNLNGLPEEDITSWERWLTPYDGVQHGKDVFIICFRERKYSFSLLGKVFRTDICKEVLSDIVAAGIHDEYIRIAEDALLYFMLSYTAQSYNGIQGKKYYQYYLGNGGFGHKEYTLSFFDSLCRQSLLTGHMKSFLERHDTMDSYADTIHRMRQSLLNNVTWAWSNKLAESDKAQGFDLMLRYWNHDKIIGKLAEVRFNETAEMARLLQGSVSLKYNGHPIKTIATYYHKLANGDTERVLCRLCYIWKEMGYKVLVVTDQQPTESDYPLPDGVQNLIIPSFRTILSQNYQTRAAALCNIIKEYHIDAFVHHGWWMESVFWDALAIKAAGAAFIEYHHSIFTNAFLWPKDHFENLLAPFTLADACVTLSEINYAFLKYYCANIHVTINPLSEDLATWTPAKYQSNHRILWLGRLTWDTRPLDALLIMQEVLKEVPDATLSLVGESEDGKLEPILKNKITELHLEDHVVYEGFHKDVRHWCQTSQIFLITSSYEGYLMTLLESKTAGIPCVMYEMPYLSLCEGSKGLISVPQEDIKAAAQAIIKLLQDDTLCAQYGHDARAHIEELAQFDFKKKWQQIFESVEHTHASIVSKTEKLMMETLIAYHGKSLQYADTEIKRLKQELDSRNCEIHELRHGNYIKRVARAVVPNWIKAFFKALRRMPQG